MKLSDFDYNLPKELIAQYPAETRGKSRLLVLHRNTGKIEHRAFKDVSGYFDKGDLMVLNDTRVVPSRLVGKKQTGGKIEALILYNNRMAHEVNGEYEVLLKPTKGCRVGSKLIFGDGELEAEITKIHNGRRYLRFNSNKDIDGVLNDLGETPLPPYIKRREESFDKERYQTIYAAKRGAIAAPTAGLHFTQDILSGISRKGVDIEYLTLHIGYGTFKPITCEDITRHQMHKEYFEIRDELVEKVKRKETRVIAVGTTTCRTLEAIFGSGQRTYSGWTDLFIHPPYTFKAVDVLLTNFHLPRTTLLMLVSAFCKTDFLLKAYKEAIKQGYRFYSYGDAMLVL